MPYREKGRWRAVPKFRGRRLQTKWCRTKREATQWEMEQRERAEKEENSPKSMDLMDFCLKYLEFSERYSIKVYKEKRSVCTRILKEWPPDISVEQITQEMVEKYLTKQMKHRSANAANKDRKNLLAMWNKGVKTYGVESNPFTNVEKFAHDRQIQYTPPTEDVLKILAVAKREERIFLYAYIFTGARRSEIFRWTWDEDINFERRQYRLGTRKTRDGSMDYEWFSMPTELHQELSWWYKNRPVKESPYVFTNDRPQSAYYGQRYTTRHKFMKTICERAKVKSFGFHSLRRFFASRLADMDKGTQTIQRLLRHKELSTTERYIHNINRDLKGITDGLLEEKVHIDSTHNNEDQNLDDITT